MAWYGFGRWRPYVPVATRRARAAREMAQLQKKGTHVQPVTLTGRKIASTFWGEAWCENLESYSDFENRLPRGRTYVRNGSVCHLAIGKGNIEAKVSGSSLYTVKIGVSTLPAAKWKNLKACCAGQVGSLLELLQGKLSHRVMAIVTDRKNGLFPSPAEIRLSCSCPDWATMCKHVAAVLYGVGARLDEKPELLFLLRGVDHQDLISKDAAQAAVAKGSRAGARTLSETSLGDVFGIDIAQGEPAAATRRTRKQPTSKRAAAATSVAAKKARRSGEANKAAPPKSKTRPAVAKPIRATATKNAAAKKKAAAKPPKRLPISSTGATTKVRRAKRKTSAKKKSGPS